MIESGYGLSSDTKIIPQLGPFHLFGDRKYEYKYNFHFRIVKLYD